MLAIGALILPLDDGLVGDDSVVLVVTGARDWDNGGGVTVDVSVDKLVGNGCDVAIF